MVRAAPDWFSDNLYSCLFYTNDHGTGTGTIWQAGSFFNNDNRGRVAKVYGVYCFAEGGGGAFADIVEGSAGNAYQTARNVRGDQGAGTVQSFTQPTVLNTNPLNPYATGNEYLAFPAPGFDSSLTVSPFPLAVIPAGFSLALISPSGTVQFGVAIYYLPANK